MKALLEVLKRGAPRDVAMYVWIREIQRGYGCVYVSVSSLSSRQPLVGVCMYMHVNTAERLRLHKVVILLLITKNFVLKIVSYSHTTTLCNFINK